MYIYLFIYFWTVVGAHNDGIMATHYARASPNGRENGKNHWQKESKQDYNVVVWNRVS
jgi:hypothetical protein